MAGIHNDASNKNCLPFFNRLAVGIFKVLSITKLANILESLTGIGNPFHYSLSFYFYYLLCTYFINARPHNFLLLLILFFTFIESILENVDDVLCLSILTNEGDTYIFTTMTMIQSKHSFILL